MNMHKKLDKRHISSLVRLVALLAALGTTLTAAWMVAGGAHPAAHAAAPAIKETALPYTYPWGLAFDTKGNVWVAEMGCDPRPTCGPQTGAIAEYNRQSFALEQNFAEPANFSSPMFLAVDGSGNLWFTEPATNAIGELIPGGPTWKQFSVPAANAMPYDLVFDKSGNLWFTEFNAGNIGEFMPSTGTFNETPTPSSGSNPYGIAGPDPSTGSLWFTENNSSVARIGRFTPPSSGTLSTGAISEYLVSNPVYNTTPHLLTFDTQGNIWWTEGFDGRIGRLAINQAQNGTSNGVTEFNVPPPTCTSCNVHISGIGVDAANMVWFDDSLSDRIGVFDPGSSAFTMYNLPNDTGNGNKHPHDGLAIDSSNNIWFSEEFANNLGEAIQSSPPAPVNKNWYFGEGRVGNGFNEYLTLDNPDPSHACAVNVQYLYTPDGGSAQAKTISITVNPSTRATRYVDGDLGYSPTQSKAADVSTFVTVNASATPNCAGIVAERPMYFHYMSGVNSGDDAMGATHTGTTFNFADVPTGGGYASYFTILNPGSASATVTATYYAGGSQVKQQTVQVSGGTRGTINPNGLGLPQHVAAILTSTQPVLIERPSYYANINAGNAGTVSGGAVVLGASAGATDWLFAEGSTQTGFQEQFVLANLDTSANTTANVTITLEFTNGTTQSHTLSVAPESQSIWSVNQYAPSVDSISAEITSTGAAIVAERQMFFHYHAGGNPSAIGVTDVTGEPGPAAQSAYSFAEGYVGSGFNEWLTVQNPTAVSERILLTIINGAGQIYTQWLSIGPRTRSTLNITNLGHQYLSKDSALSMLLQAANNTPFVAERPMYWNQGGMMATQGGSDVIGYYGE